VGPSGSARRGKYLMVPAAMRALRREPFDVLVVRGTRILGLPGLREGRRLGRPVVLQAEVNGEMSGEVYTWGTPLAKWPWRDAVQAAVRLRNRALLKADTFVAMSRQIRDEFVAAGVDPARVAHLPHGVDTSAWRPASPEERGALRAALGLSADAVIVTYTGRLLRGKGLGTLVEAFSRTVPVDGRLHLLVVGSGEGQALSVEDEMKTDIVRRGLSARVTLTGRVENVADHLRASDIFAFPSVYEALGLSLVEAAACGLACVGTRTGGIVDVIEDGVTGRLVEPGDAAHLARTLAELAGDRAERERLGAAARHRAVSGFDLAASVERYRELFDGLRPRPPACSTEHAAREDAAPPR
jgi:glycosyltransferase involved in cell wall biosynthesis